MVGPWTPVPADAPGMTPEDINVELNDNTLVITGSKVGQAPQALLSCSRAPRLM
jgi:HSP20 family molecular chaperone IbpA